MNQQKIGSFLKELRKEKNLTQEKFAEIMGVSNRSVSRWETGSNLPDLDILIQIADFYEVELREILDGERKSEKMNKELEETVLKVAEYSNEDKKKVTKRMHMLYIGGTVSIILYLVMLFTDTAETFANGMVSGICLGIAFGMLIFGCLMTSRYAAKIRAFKMRLLHRNR